MQSLKWEVCVSIRQALPWGLQNKNPIWKVCAARAACLQMFDTSRPGELREDKLRGFKMALKIEGVVIASIMVANGTRGLKGVFRYFLAVIHDLSYATDIHATESPPLSTLL